MTTMETSGDVQAIGDRRRDGGRAEVARVVRRAHEAALVVEQAPPGELAHGVEHEEEQDEGEGGHERVAREVLGAQPAPDGAVRDPPGEVARDEGHVDQGLAGKRRSAPGSSARASSAPSAASSSARALGRHVALEDGLGFLAERQAEAGKGAEELHAADARQQPVRALARAGPYQDLLGPDGERHRRPRGKPFARAAEHLRRPHAHPARARARRPRDEVHLPHEARHERRGRLRVHGDRRAHLLHGAVVHHDDAIGHGQRLFLVVRHHDRGDAEPPLQPADLEAQRLAHPRVERGQRLVEQEQGGLRRERAGQRHALLLAARELGGILVLVVPEPHQREELVDAAVDLRARRAAPLEPVGDIARDGEVREQRIRLEDDAVVSLGGRQPRHVAARHADEPRVLALEAGDDPQERGLAAAARPEEADELAGLDGQRDVAERDERAELLGDALEGDRRRSRRRAAHPASPRGAWAATTSRKPAP